MKKLFFLTAIFLCLRFHSQSSFPDLHDAPQWSVLTKVWNRYATERIRYGSDTVLCGRNYLKVISNNQIEGYLRAEGEKIFIKRNSACDTKELKIYDFSLNRGDTTFCGLYPNDSAKFWIEKIDTVKYFGRNRARFTVNYRSGGINTMYWIKGIGSAIHPFYPLYCLTDNCEAVYSLLCYHSSDTLFYENPIFLTCDTTNVGIRESQINILKCSIDPDPFVNETTLKIYNPTAGTYYIKGTTPSGCFDIKPVTVTVYPTPTVIITNPAAVCSPATADLTLAAVTAGSTAGLTFTYWTDAAATIAYTTPTTAPAGTYYIKGTTAAGCFDITPVTVTVNPAPTVVITNPAAVCAPATVNLTLAAVTAGSTAGLTYTYWTDAAGTISYATPATATAGTYYIKGTAASGCFDIKPVTVTVNPTPTVVITNPAAVCAPATANLTLAAVTAGSTAGLTYTYWTDAAATISYATPTTATAGTYYIKGTTAAGCFDIKPVTVTVNPTPTVVITNPAAVCSPGNG